MILADTSIWIRHISDRLPESAWLEDLLRGEQICGHPLIFGELLIGDKGGRKELLSLYKKLPQLEMVPHDEVVEFAQTRRLHGRGVGWIDIHILASALVARIPVWTADLSFAEIANELKAAYEPPPTLPPALGLVRPPGRR